MTIKTFKVTWKTVEQLRKSHEITIRIDEQEMKDLAKIANIQFVEI